MKKDSAIFVAGHNGLAGSAVVRYLQKEQYSNIIIRNRSELDLMNGNQVDEFFKTETPEYVIDCAAKVGGIKSNMSYPAEFLYENLQIQNNLMWSSQRYGVRKFLFLSSACIYPIECEQPMREEYFMQGRPESANEAYAIAKISGMKLCEYINKEFGSSFLSCTPTNLYGENCNFDLESAHVIPAMIRRLHEAKINEISEVEIWGTGNTRREFLHVDDLAEALVFLIDNYDDKQFLNIGTGSDISIMELATLIKDIVGYSGDLHFDATKPDGVPMRLLDVSRINELGWKHSINLIDGLKRTYAWYLNQICD